MSITPFKDINLRRKFQYTWNLLHFVLAKSCSSHWQILADVDESGLAPTVKDISNKELESSEVACSIA